MYSIFQNNYHNHIVTQPNDDLMLVLAAAANINANAFGDHERQHLTHALLKEPMTDREDINLGRKDPSPLRL